MKYNNLLRFLLLWTNGLMNVKFETDYKAALKSPVLDQKYKDDLKLARKEYLAYKQDEQL